MLDDQTRKYAAIAKRLILEQNFTTQAALMEIRKKTQGTDDPYALKAQEKEIHASLEADKEIRRHRKLFGKRGGFYHGNT